jgi:hypothetical protein
MGYGLVTASINALVNNKGYPSCHRATKVILFVTVIRAFSAFIVVPCR